MLEVPLHRIHLDGRQQIINECDVLILEFATIHQAQPFGCGATTCVESVPCGQRPVPEYSARRALASPEFGTKTDWNKTGEASCGLARSLPHLLVQSIFGSMIDANAFRALFSRDFTVPRLQSVMSAISSYDFPSSSRSTNT